MPGDCKELERQFADSDCKCNRYRELFPDCQCENCSVSDHSPGPVKADETLIRTVYSPLQINAATNMVDPAFFRDARSRGLSVNRKSHTAEEKLTALIEAKVKKDQDEGRKKDGFWRVVTANCGDIRGVVDEPDDAAKRLFCVYDSAKEDDPSHADVCQNTDVPPKTPDRNSRRKRITSRLFEKFGPAITLSEAFSKAE